MYKVDRKYTLKYLGVNDQDVFNLTSNSSEKKIVYKYINT